jgi:serine/threonine-protein kinase
LLGEIEMATLRSGLQIGEKIGAGFFGQVFRGEDETHGTVAVKVLTPKPHWSAGEWEERRRGFVAEAQRLSKAADDHVVQVHHVLASEDDDSVHICMEYCSGGSLQKPYEQGPMTLKAVQQVATDMLLGLQTLHLREMLHRDIKPANLLRDARGKVKLGDFGLVTDQLIQGYADQADYAYGDHLAYEVWHGRGTSVKSDIWAVGATLYRLLHGKQWYDLVERPRHSIADGGFADRLQWLPHVPKRWRRVIRQMMEDDTTRRYGSADQALSAVSSLPNQPEWECTVDPEADAVRWELLKGNRVQKVEWDRTLKKNQWSAWSEPMLGSKGQKKTLDGSGGAVSAKAALSGLEGFFLG